MLRPADIAPESMRYNSESAWHIAHLLDTLKITFCNDGSASFLWYQERHFEIRFPRSSSLRLGAFLANG